MRWRSALALAAVTILGARSSGAATPGEPGSVRISNGTDWIDYDLDTTATGTITALNGVVQVALKGQHSAAVLLAGTWTATIGAEVSCDGGTTWETTALFDVSDMLLRGSTTVNGTFVVMYTVGMSHARVKATAFTSGTVTVTLRSTKGVQMIDDLRLAQGSTTSGQAGVLVQGAVTTGVPTYTTGQTSPLSLETDGDLRTACQVESFPANQPFNLAQWGGTATTLGQKTMTASAPVVIASDQAVVLGAGAAVIGSLAANQSVNVAQVNGVATTTGNGISGTGVQRVTLASDSTGQVTLAAGAATIGSLAANQSVNVAQIGGVAPLMGNGLSGTGAQRVTIASDSTGQVTLAAGAATIGSLAANQSVNTAQINGVAPTMGNGISGTGVQRVTIASDSTGQVTLAAGAATIGSLAANQSVNAAQWGGTAVAGGVGASTAGSPRVAAASDDPCQSSAVVKSSVVVNATADAELVPLTGGQTVYVCSFSFTLTGTTPTARLVTGTGTTCATGLTARTGAYAPASGGLLMAGGGFVVTKGASGEALCIDLEGTTPSAQGVLSYVKQ